MTKERRDLLFHFPADIIEVLEKMEKIKLPRDGQKLTVLTIEQKIDEARKTILKGAIPKELLDSNWFLTQGIMLLEIITREYGFDYMEFARFLLGKHTKYTMRPLLVWKELGILVRLQSKIARATSVMGDSKGIDLGDETLKDTLEDSLGYCVLGYKLVEWLKGEKGNEHK